MSYAKCVVRIKISVVCDTICSCAFLISCKIVVAKTSFIYDSYKGSRTFKISSNSIPVKICIWEYLHVHRNGTNHTLSCT